MKKYLFVLLLAFPMVSYAQNYLYDLTIGHGNSVGLKINPYVTGSGIGTFNLTNLSYANGFSVARNNEVYRFGYNIGTNGLPLDTNDDSFFDAWETHYAASASVYQFERHWEIDKKGGGSVRPLSVSVQKWNSVTPYYTQWSMSGDKISFFDPTIANNVMQIRPNTSTQGDGQVEVDGYFIVNGITSNNVAGFNQKKAATNLDVLWQIGDSNKWITSVLATSFNYRLYNQTQNANALTIAASDSAATFGGSVSTVAPNGGTAAAWKFGTYVTGHCDIDTSHYIQLDVGGTLVKVAPCL